MRLPLLACVASVAAYSAKLQTHMYQTTDLWRDSDVPSLRPVSTAQSPAATKLSLLDVAPDNEDPNNTTYCVAHGGQTMVDDKWCFMSCNNVPPNCPKDLCDCVKGVEAKKKVDKVKQQLKEQPAEASQARLAEREDGEGHLSFNPSRLQEEDTAHKLAQLVHHQQAVHQKEQGPWQPGQLGVRGPTAFPGPPRAKSDAERKYDESQSAWAVKDYQAPELTVESKSAASFLQTEDATQAAEADLRDQHTSCGGWAARGECMKNPTFMASECAESCSGTEAAAAAAALADWGELQRSAGTADSKASSVNLLQAEVARDPAGELLDKDPSCAGWAAAGECTKNPSFMMISCALACRGQLGSGSAPSSPASVVDLVQPQQAQPQQQQQQQQQPPPSGGAVDSRREFAQAAGLIQPDATEGTPAAESSATGAVDLVAAAKDGSFQDLVAAVAQTVVDKTKGSAAKAAAVHAAAEAKSKSKSKSKSADAPAKVEDDTDGANLTTNSTNSCPFCGFKEIPNCCSKGASWEGTCSAVATKTSPSWEDGFNACRGLHVAMMREAQGRNADGSKKEEAPVKEKKCDSEREEWCDGAGDGDTDLPEGADPINCVAVNSGQVEDQWCVVNCGFTPPNCLKDLCRCPVAGAASGNTTSRAKGSKGAKGDKGEQEEGMSEFALAFERGRKEMAKEMGMATSKAAPKATSKKASKATSKKATSKKTSKAEKLETNSSSSQQQQQEQQQQQQQQEEQQEQQQEEADEDEEEDEEEGEEEGEQKVKKPKKSDEEIYLETCDKNPSMKGCPTCDQAPSMPHCGLNQESWQDLTGLPEGADPSSCKAVSQVEDTWCVQNCGGTPPNCPASLCKCKAPGGSDAAKASSKAEAKAAAPEAKGVAPSPIHPVGKAPSSPSPAAASEATAQAEPAPQQQQQASGAAEEGQQGAPREEEEEIERPVDDDEEIEGVGFVRGWTAQDTQQEAQIREDREQEARCRVGPDGFCHKEGEKVPPAPRPRPSARP